MNSVIRKMIIILIIIITAILLVYLFNDVQTEQGAAHKNEHIKVVLPDCDIMDMAFHGNTVFAGGRDGVYKIEKTDGELTARTVKLANKVSYVKSLLLVDEELWIGHDNGIVIYDISTCKEKSINSNNSPLPDDRVNALYQDSKGRIWIGTWEGAAYLSDSTWNFVTTDNGLLSNMVNVITEDHMGGMWFGSYTITKGGVSCIHNGKWQYFIPGKGLANPNVTDIICDSGNNILIGTGFYDKGGMSFVEYKNSCWKTSKILCKSDGLAGEKTRSLYENKQGVLFVGSEYNGLSIIENDDIKILTEEDGISNNEIKVICQDNDGYVWLGTRKGITVFDLQILHMEVHN